MNSFFRPPIIEAVQHAAPPPPPSPVDPNSGAQAAINQAQADQQNRARGRAATTLSDQSSGSDSPTNRAPSARNVLLGS